MKLALQQSLCKTGLGKFFRSSIEFPLSIKLAIISASGVRPMHTNERAFLVRDLTPPCKMVPFVLRRKWKIYDVPQHSSAFPLLKCSLKSTDNNPLTSSYRHISSMYDNFSRCCR